MFVIAAMLLVLGISVKAESQVTLIRHTAGSTSTVPNGVNENGSLVLGASYDEEELTVSIENYSGEVTISLVDMPTLETVMSDEEAVSDILTHHIDITSLPSSTYILYIEFDNGSIYYGIMQI